MEPQSTMPTSQAGNEKMKICIAAAVSSHLQDSLPEQPLPAVQLLPKPKYSSLPEHDGKKLVLVVDGDAKTADTVSGLLVCQPEFVIASASSGEVALQQLEQLPYLPNCILLAKRLSGVTGRQVCSALRAVYTPQELPIIKLLPKHTAYLGTKNSMEAGVNDCIIKPIGQVELLSRLNTHIVLPQMAAAEADRNHKLLEAILPPRIIERLKTGSKVIAEQHEQVTILFSDIVNFTTMSHELPTEFIINMLEELFSAFDECCDKHGVYKVETIGDAYMCVAGHEGHCDDHALCMIEMAESMLHATERVGRIIGRDLQIRIGLHTGPAYSGVVGKKCPRYCFFGDTVNTASRMESSSFPMCIHFSQATKASLDRAWMLRSLRNSAGGAAGEEAAADVREVAPESISLGARYQKGKGLVTSHLLKVGNFKEALTHLGLDPDQRGASSPRAEKDMHSALMQASAAAAVVGTLQNEARKALSNTGILSGVRKNTLDLEGALNAKTWRARPATATPHLRGPAE